MIYASFYISVEEFLLLKLLKRAAARAEAEAGAAQAQTGDSGIETGSDGMPNAESRDQTDAEQNNMVAENPADRKKRASVESRNSDVRHKSGTKEKKERRTSERSIRSNDEVFEEDPKRSGTVEAKKSAVLKKRKRSTVSQPDNH